MQYTSQSQEGDERFRLVLSRRWHNPLTPSTRVLAIVMLNPSTATGDEDDPTIRRCAHFADDWGYGGIDVVNLYPFRTAGPQTLLLWLKLDARYEEIHMADHRIAKVCSGRDVLVAWGHHGAKVPSRCKAVLGIIRPMANGIYSLGVTADYQPRHPLYVLASTPPMKFTRTTTEPL